jgi:hypothetical protein
MREIHTSIDIDAPAETVWATLTDFPSYPEWHPRMVVTGEAREGARLVVAPGPDAEGMPTFEPRVLSADPNRELVWKGKLYLPGLFDGTHRFAIEALADDRSRLVQSESFAGLLVGLIMRRYGADTEAGFHATNEALRDEAERRAAARDTAPDPAAA